MEIYSSTKPTGRDSYGLNEPRTTVIVETSEAEIIINVNIHRRPQKVAFIVDDESYVNSTSDLGAMEMIARANSISDAKD